MWKTSRTSRKKKGKNDYWKFFSLHVKTHQKSLKHASVYSSGKQCVAVSLWLWFGTNTTNGTLSWRVGVSHSALSLTQAFQRQPFIPESTDHSEIMLVVRWRVGNMESLRLETQQLNFLQKPPTKIVTRSLTCTFILVSVEFKVKI